MHARTTKNIAKLHSRGTDELVVEPCDNILELVGSLEGLAGLGPPPGSGVLFGTEASLCIEPRAGWRAMCMRMYA